MAREELEGEWVQGWPDRRRARLMPSKDADGRTIYARTPLLELEGLITPTDAYYIIAQLNMPEPIHPDDYSFKVTGLAPKAGRFIGRSRGARAGNLPNPRRRGGTGDRGSVRARQR